MRRKEKNSTSCLSFFKQPVLKKAEKLIIELVLDLGELLLIFNLQPTKITNLDLLLLILKQGSKKVGLAPTPTINKTRINSTQFTPQLRSKFEKILQKQLLQQPITPVEAMQRFNTKRIFLQGQVISVTSNIPLAPMITLGLLTITQRLT